MATGSLLKAKRPGLWPGLPSCLSRTRRQCELCVWNPGTSARHVPAPPPPRMPTISLPTTSAVQRRTVSPRPRQLWPVSSPLSRCGPRHLSDDRNLAAVCLPPPNVLRTSASAVLREANGVWLPRARGGGVTGGAAPPRWPHLRGSRQHRRTALSSRRPPLRPDSPPALVDTPDTVRPAVRPQEVRFLHSPSSVARTARPSRRALPPTAAVTSRADACFMPPSSRAQAPRARAAYAFVLCSVRST